MIAASFFSRIVPAPEGAEEDYGARPLPAAIAVGGILLGFVVVAGMNALLPRRHFLSGREGPASPALRKIWLFIAAITIRAILDWLAQTR